MTQLLLGDALAGMLFDLEAETGEYKFSYNTWSDYIPLVFDAASRTFKQQERPSA